MRGSRLRSVRNDADALGPFTAGRVFRSSSAASVVAALGSGRVVAGATAASAAPHGARDVDSGAAVSAVFAVISAATAASAAHACVASVFTGAVRSSRAATAAASARAVTSAFSTGVERGSGRSGRRASRSTRSAGRTARRRLNDDRARGVFEKRSRPGRACVPAAADLVGRCSSRCQRDVRLLRVGAASAADFVARASSATAADALDAVVRRVPIRRNAPRRSRRENDDGRSTRAAGDAFDIGRRRTGALRMGEGDEERKESDSSRKSFVRFFFCQVKWARSRSRRSLKSFSFIRLSGLRSSSRKRRLDLHVFCL